MTIGIKDIAALADVSMATVSRVLSGKSVRPVYRQRVETALATLDYRPNLAARRLRSRSASVVGLIVPDIANPFFVRFVQAVETYAWREGLRVILCNSAEDPERETHLLDLLAEERVSGILLAPTQAGGVPTISTPLVVIDRVEGTPRVDSVRLDNVAAARALVEALAAAGSTRILGLFGDHGSTAVERCQGFTEALDRLGLPVHIARVPHETARRAAAVGTALTEHRCDAIVVGDNLTMLEVAVALKTRPPVAPVRLAGFDGAPWLRLLDANPLIVAQPVDAMAHAALALLVGRMAGGDGDPVQRMFDGTIVSGA
ncbi:LacI family DNA-binding transcriptional regulator [Sphingomonas sp. 4RDLI-65]|uniref:LacI family DNA-binding transcriptional regulator n=1 Tax=Sphingomonas sp. 4RDLI-65 TaxID=3111641 RepID=UPI003C1CD522